LAGYLAGVSVAVKQAMPDHVLYRSPLGKITNRNIPLAVFGLSFIMWAVGLVEGSYCTMFGSGLVISWIYLRFYQLHANGTRGDAADGFSFTRFEFMNFNEFLFAYLLLQDIKIKRKNSFFITFRLKWLLKIVY
jgi:hypothetical protein